MLTASHVRSYSESLMEVAGEKSQFDISLFAIFSSKRIPYVSRFRFVLPYQLSNILRLLSSHFAPIYTKRKISSEMSPSNSLMRLIMISNSLEMVDVTKMYE